jgi:hypothetical protein
MTSIKDVAGIIITLGDIVKSTREVIDAVNDGKKFLALKHPEAQKDFSKLIEQMQRAIIGMTRVTSLISSFRFVTDGKLVDRATADSELARFNNYVIAQKKDIDALKNDIRQLKADCKKVRQLRDKLDTRSKDRSWGSLFGLLGAKAEKRTLELHSTISNFYADDQRMIEFFGQTLALAEGAIKDVEEVLGPPGTTNPYNVPQAAAMLGSYSVLFEAPSKQLHELADAMSDVQSDLITTTKT